MRITLSVVFMIGFGLAGLQAQTAIPAAGGDATGSGGSSSYSVGQVVYTTDSATAGSVAQGVQQPYEISIVVGTEEASSINLVVTAYPNPANAYLTLRVEAFDGSDLSYQLYDMQGKLLENKKIEGSETSIVMSNLAPAIYFVKVTEGDQEVKTFKVIKN